MTLPGCFPRIGKVRDLAVLPLEVHLIPAAGPQAGDLSVWPGIGQGGQEADHVVMALQDHFCDTGCAAEVAVGSGTAGAGRRG